MARRRRAGAEQEQEQKARRTERRYWLTSAGRLIAGMKYLGQWEERCEQLIAELATLGGVLCVERLLDLLRYGGAGPVDSLAAFFQPYLQRGELRLVGECTPGELDACRRLLPGFADLFPILQVLPFGRPQALAVLDRTAERYARDLRLQVASGVSERTYHLFRRFAPYQVFPGAAVGFMRDLCECQAKTDRQMAVSAETVVDQFVRRTGLPPWLVRDEVTLDAQQLRADLRRHVLGQEAALEAAARVVTTFKAGLNDPRRPIGVLLFCGLTGVGKTELARALAGVVFGHGELQTQHRKDDRLVRLDMSEYAGLDAVVSFEPLTRETIRAIAGKELGALAEREGLHKAGIRLTWSERLVEWLAREGFNARFGARPLQRLLERQVVTAIAKFLLEAPGLRDAELHLDYAAEDGGRVLCS